MHSMDRRKLRAGPASGGYSIDFIYMAFEETLKRQLKMESTKLMRKTMSSGLMEFVLSGMCSETENDRKKSYALFEAIWNILRRLRGKNRLMTRWAFVLETLRLSIRSPYQILTVDKAKFVYKAMYILKDPNAAHYSFISQWLGNKRLVNGKLPVQTKWFFQDIETQSSVEWCKRQKTDNVYINNRQITLMYQ